MIIGKWNKSVLMTYIGMAISILGMVLSRKQFIDYSIYCLMAAGLCDLLDGPIARKCKRTEEEKQFGIQLDSLVDVVSFVVFPIVLLISRGYTEWYSTLAYIFYGICGIARLGHFNITLEEKNKDVSVDYYQGLPVTTIAVIFPVTYLISFMFAPSMVQEALTTMMALVGVGFIANIPVMKPKGKYTYLFFFLLAVVIAFLYLIVW